MFIGEIFLSLTLMTFNLQLHNHYLLDEVIDVVVDWVAAVQKIF